MSTLATIVNSPIPRVFCFQATHIRLQSLAEYAVMFLSLTSVILDVQCFTVQPVLEEHPQFKNKPVPDQIITWVYVFVETDCIKMLESGTVSGLSSVWLPYQLEI